ncbi:MAG: ORF6N domain-containing protein [Bacteroidota bacterium]
MAKSITITDNLIQTKIYFIRGQKVMLDRDLAELYGVETRRLNEQVKRNIKRFPVRFMFKLDEKEVELMVSQNAIPSKQVLGGSLPNVFTEHGVLMLANILKSNKAMEVSIKIIDVFIKLREMILNHKDILHKLEQIDNKIIHLGLDIKTHDGEIETLFELVDEIRKASEQQKKLKPNPIGFKISKTKKY